jgi:anti-sigma B factor antagonist
MKAPTDFGWSTYGNHVIGIPVRGEIDLASVPSLSGAIGELIQRGYRYVALDLGAVEFTDSRGINVLVAMRQHPQDAGGQLVVQAASTPVPRVLEVAGLRWLMPDEAESPSGATGAYRAPLML